MKTIFLLRGVPGAGKTTTALFLAGLIGEKAVSVSADDFMVDANGKHQYDPSRLPEVHSRCQEAAHQAMRDGVEAIFVHNTMTREWELDDYYLLAAMHDYRVASLIVENRHGNKSVHNFPEDGYDRYADRFQTKFKP